MSDSEGEGEFVHYGTPLTAPEEVPRRHEFQKTEVRDEATVQQNLPVWKQVLPQSSPIICGLELELGWAAENPRLGPSPSRAVA